MCKKIDSAAASLEADSPEDDVLKSKVGEMNDLLRTVQADAKDKETNMQEALRQVMALSYNQIPEPMYSIPNIPRTSKRCFTYLQGEF